MSDERRELIRFKTAVNKLRCLRTGLICMVEADPGPDRPKCGCANCVVFREAWGRGN